MNQLFPYFLNKESFPLSFFYQNVFPFWTPRNKITFLSHPKLNSEETTNVFKMIPGWIISTASCFTLHPPWSSLSHIPDLNLINLWELESLLARGVAVGQAGRILCAWYCNCEILLDGQEVILFGKIFFKQMSWKSAAAQFGVQRVDSLETVVPGRSPSP